MPSIHRRMLLLSAAALSLPSHAAGAFDFQGIEKRCGGKLGVSIVDTASGRYFGWRQDERFPFCSSFKAPLAAFVLWQADQGALRLDDPVAYGQADLLSYAPAAREHADRGFMTVRALCAAAVELSDNTATNLLLKLTGGPQALTAWMRGQGDPEFDLSDNEPGLNLARFGDRRNTTTPRAMCASYRRFAFADALAPASREQLKAWLIASPTGAKRLRAGLPPNWQAGDKTGTFNGPWFSTIDVAIAMPPERAPIVIAAFVTDTPDTATAERAMVEVARKVALQRGALFSHAA